MKTQLIKNDRAGERRTNGNAVARQPTAQRRSVGAPGVSGLVFRDNRSAGVAQRRLQKVVDGSQRQLAQAEQVLPLQRVIDEAALQMMSGPVAVQRREVEEEEPLQGRFGTAQRQGPEEEELVQGRFETRQRQGPEEEEPLQGRFDSVVAPAQLKAGAGELENRTGMPDQLKAGVEQLSGMDLSDVRVHTNSPKTAQLNALAYAQGNDIHLGPGQEKHLPHETWHVVQQRQGRVTPTMLAKGVAINDDQGLEKEADVMGERAASSLTAAGKESNAVAGKGGAGSKTGAVQRKPLKVGGSRRTALGLNGIFKTIKLVFAGSGKKDWNTGVPEDAEILKHYHNSENEKKNILKKGLIRRHKRQRVYKTDKSGKVEFTFAGPLGFLGSDIGLNKTSRSIDLGKSIGKIEIQKALDEKEGDEKEGDEKEGVEKKGDYRIILVLIKGWSRGAVAASRVATFLQEEFKDKIWVTIELVLFDPVMGPNKKKPHDPRKNTEISNISTSTLVYSLGEAARWNGKDKLELFKPQRVMGGKRVILSTQEHSGGTTNAYKFPPESDSYYAGSNLNSMPEGLYLGLGTEMIQPKSAEVVPEDGIEPVTNGAADVSRGMCEKLKKLEHPKEVQDALAETKLKKGRREIINEVALEVVNPTTIIKRAQRTINDLDHIRYNMITKRIDNIIRALQYFIQNMNGYTKERCMESVRQKVITLLELLKEKGKEEHHKIQKINDCLDHLNTVQKRIQQIYEERLGEEYIPQGLFDYGKPTYVFIDWRDPHRERA